MFYQVKPTSAENTYWFHQGNQHVLKIPIGFTNGFHTFALQTIGFLDDFGGWHLKKFVFPYVFEGRHPTKLVLPYVFEGLCMKNVCFP